MATPAERVASPRRRPRKGGIGSVADFRSNDRLGRAGTLQFDADVCSPVVGAVQLCFGPDVDAQDKVGTQGFSSGAPALLPFGGYIGVECFIHPDNDYDARARAALELAQDRFIEEQLWAWLNAAPSTAAADLKAAVSAADDFADENYIGLPVIHVNRGDVVGLGLDPNPVDDGKLWTKNGTPVIASSKYAAGTVVVTGDVTVEQSAIVTAPAIEYGRNLEMAIAERVWSVLVDCDFRHKFTVTP